MRNMKVLVLHRPSGPRGGDTKVAKQFAEALDSFEGVEAAYQGADVLDNVRLFDFVHIFAAVDTGWGMPAVLTLVRDGVPFTITPFYYPRDERLKFYGQFGDVTPGYKETIAFILEQSLAMACVTMGEYRTCLELIGRYHPGFMMGYGFTPPEGNLYETVQDYVFQLGRVEPHKNQGSVAIACSVLGVPYISAGVVTHEGYGKLIEYNGGKVMGEISDEEAMKLLAGARVHAAPTFGECIAQVNCEAAYYGTPMVIGLGHDWEYFGDGAEYCKPSDWRDVAGAIRRAWDRKRSPWQDQPTWADAAGSWLAYIRNNNLWTG